MLGVAYLDAVEGKACVDVVVLPVLMMRVLLVALVSVVVPVLVWWSVWLWMVLCVCARV